MVFSVERFHEYLYGRKFTVINDHQPLKSIFSKSYSEVFFTFTKYEFDLKYSPGETMLVSDALSRAYTKGAATDTRYFARSTFSRSLVHKENFSMI